MAISEIRSRVESKKLPNLEAKPDTRATRPSKMSSSPPSRMQKPAVRTWSWE